MKIQYDKIAENYAQFRESDSDAVEKLILGSGISSTSKILEIGCGTGNYVSALQRRVGCHCWGVDPAPEMIRHAMKQNSRVTFSVGSAENLGFRDEFFDFVFSVDVIHHVDKRAGYFLEAYRVLRPPGLLATLTDSEDTIRQRMPLAFYFPEIVEHEIKRYPTSSELRRRSQAAGFKITREQVTETPFCLDNIEKYRNKAFSCLRLVSAQSFATGIEKMSQDLANGPIACVSRNLIIWNGK
ncbi:MAG: class I SAM-dependent methyltransferase [Planctomycetota bacterium]|jgi:ubiquinone/menaquinone biosynthesis C-methylase UbiE